MITKKEFDSLYSDEITKKAYDAIIAKIDSRVYVILKAISKSMKWWAYGNYNHDSEGDGGHFDIEDYKEFVSISGDIKLPASSPDGFPTCWLWKDDWQTDFENEVRKYNKTVEDKKNKEIAAKQRRKDKLVLLQKSIKSKLTSEELKAISFK